MPRWTAVSVAFAPVFAGVLAACGGDAQPDANNPLSQLTAAAEQMQKAAEELHQQPEARAAGRLPGADRVSSPRTWQG